MGFTFKLLFLLLASPILLSSFTPVRAQEDPIEDEIDEDAVVESEEDENVATADTELEEGEESDDEDEEEKPLQKSPDADTFHIFQGIQGTEIPAGKSVRVLVGFRNKGDKQFVVETMDASFRYPQDYSYYMQNFTHARFNTVVESGEEATFYYAFFPNEGFAGRPFGLTVNVNYKDSADNYFQDAVFNETVTIIESDEGMDGETFFLYVFLAAIVVLLALGGQQLLGSFTKKISKPRAKPEVEMGTQNNKGDVDFDWLPMEHITAKPSPRRTPKKSPRQLRTRARGAAED